MLVHKTSQKSCGAVSETSSLKKWRTFHHLATSSLLWCSQGKMEGKLIVNRFSGSIICSFHCSFSMVCVCDQIYIYIDFWCGGIQDFGTVWQLLTCWLSVCSWSLSVLAILHCESVWRCWMEMVIMSSSTVSLNVWCHSPLQTQSCSVCSIRCSEAVVRAITADKSALLLTVDLSEFHCDGEPAMLDQKVSAHLDYQLSQLCCWLFNPCLVLLVFFFKFRHEMIHW